jgi:hypothetical protein
MGTDDFSDPTMSLLLQKLSVHIVLPFLPFFNQFSFELVQV